MNKFRSLFLLLVMFGLFAILSCNIDQNTNSPDIAATSENSADAGTASRADASLFYLDFEGAYLAYTTATNSIQIITNANVLSYGTNWQMVKIYSYLYHIKHNSWSGYYWKVNTSRKEVYYVVGPNFGRIGDANSTTLTNITVRNVGDDIAPTRFFLDFTNAYLRYDINTKNLRIYAEGFLMSDGTNWDKCNMKTYLFHIRLNTWQGFYWKINTSRKEAYRVTDAPGLCELGGTYTLMPMGVTAY